MFLHKCPAGYNLNWYAIYTIAAYDLKMTMGYYLVDDSL